MLLKNIYAKTIAILIFFLFFFSINILCQEKYNINKRSTDTFSPFMIREYNEGGIVAFKESPFIDNFKAVLPLNGFFLSHYEYLINNSIKMIETKYFKVNDMQIGSINEQSHKKNRLRISFSCGVSYLNIGDINSDVKSYNENIADLTGISPKGKTGLVHFCPIIESDLQLNIFDDFGISLGSGYIQAKKENQINFEANSNSLNVKSLPSVNAIPIKLGIYYYPINHLYINFGVDYYFVKCSYSHRLEYGTYWLETAGNASSRGIGFHGKSGIDISLFKNVFFVVEAEAGYSRISNFKGKKEINSSLGFVAKEEGYLYYYETKQAGKIYRYVGIYKSDHYELGENSRKAIVNLGGYTINLGMKIKI